VLTPQDLNNLDGFNEMVVRLAKLPISVVFVDMKNEPLENLANLNCGEPVSCVEFDWCLD
jgi:hypothetical protein